MAYHFKKAALDDSPVIRNIAEQTWGATYGEILSPEQLEWMFEWMYSPESLEKQMRDGHTFFLLYEDKSPIGYVSVNQERENRYHLQKLYLIPNKQGSGLGAKLLEKAEEFVQEIKTSEVVDLVLNVNRENKALHFYKKHGFEIESEGDFSIGNGYYMNDYILKKTLS